MNRNERLSFVTMVPKSWPFSVPASLFMMLVIGQILDVSICESEKSEVFAKDNLVDPAVNNHKEKVIEENQGCVMMDGMCIATTDVSSYEAIRALHAHLDDDQSGDIDLSESVDFLREELNYTKGFEKRQKAFHPNNDQHISVRELWEIWLANEVHNWTVEQTVGWLHVCVELGQYADVFYENAINGSLLPRLATNNEQFLARILGIKNPTHRSKISIKAMDIVLFGPPKEIGSLMKDIFIATLIFVIVVMLFKFRQVTQSNNIVVSKMEQDMETLQEELRRFQDDKFHDEKNTDSDHDEQQPDVPEDSSPVPPSESIILGDDFISSGDIPELDLEARIVLQSWLQVTHERERVVLEKKIKAMTLQFQEAKDICDKLKPSRKNLFGALSFIHGKIESRGQSIYETRTALSEIQETKKEMENRWSAMEQLLGFNIKHNPGLVYLESLLQHNLPPSVVHHTASNAGGLASTGLERRTETTSSIRSRFSYPAQTYHAISSPRQDSLVRDASLESISDASLAFSVGGSVRSLRPTSFQSPLQHSYTVGSGLSSCESDNYPTRSCSSENKMRRIASVSPLGTIGSRNNVNCNNNGYSTDETDSCKFTVGESGVINIESSLARFPEDQNSSPTHSPSASSLQESIMKEPQRNVSVEKVRTRRRRLHLLGKSYSQDEEGSFHTGEKEKIGKFSSEPSLDIVQSQPSTQQDHQPNSKPSTPQDRHSSSKPSTPQGHHPSPKPFAKGLLPKSKWITKRWKKPDRSNN